MRFFGRKPDEELWEAMNRQVMSLARAKQIDEAYSVAQGLYEYSRKAYGKKHERTVKAINNLGYVLTKRKEYDAAESYLLMALQIAEKISGKYSLEVGLVTMNLAKLYRAKAEEIFALESGYGTAQQAGAPAERPQTEQNHMNRETVDLTSHI